MDETWNMAQSLHEELAEHTLNLCRLLRDLAQAKREKRTVELALNASIRRNIIANHKDMLTSENGKAWMQFVAYMEPKFFKQTQVLYGLDSTIEALEFDIRIAELQRTDIYARYQYLAAHEHRVAHEV